MVAAAVEPAGAAAVNPDATAQAAVGRGQSCHGADVRTGESNAHLAAVARDAIRGNRSGVEDIARLNFTPTANSTVGMNLAGVDENVCSNRDLIRRHSSRRLDGDEPRSGKGNGATVH